MARIFISYSHKDEAWKDRLQEQLQVLGDHGLEFWEDRQIAGGDDWLPQIETAIARCDCALLLISAPFLTSAFIRGHEVPPLLERRQKEGIRVVPVILSPCQWQRIPWLEAINVRPKDGQPLKGMSEYDAEAALSALAGEVHDLMTVVPPDHRPGDPVPPEKIDLTHLPEGAEHFLGRETELEQLDAAWAEGTGVAVVQLIAPGGVGKTALVKRWLDNMRTAGWRSAARVFGWSFYSQGTGEDRQDIKKSSSEDPFLAAALEWFGVECDPALGPADKGRALAAAVAAAPTLLVLDGLEPLQYPPGPLAGRLRAPGLEALLGHLGLAGQAGLCLVTSRERIQELAEHERSADHPQGSVLHLDLGNLTDVDGARLLWALGVRRAGAAAVDPDDTELKAASQAVGGHALTLSLLGNYLALGFDGDIRRRDRVDFADASEATGGHAFRVMAAFERWFGQGGEEGARELAILRLLGFFDRPAVPESLDALRAAPAIEGLTEPLFEKHKGWFSFLKKPQPISERQWRIGLKRLEACGLVYPAKEGAALDAHPLVREYLARRLRRELPGAWREGHRRIYGQLKASVPHHPEGLAGLQPLYQAVAHGCLAGLQQEACVEVYRDRILRGTGSDGFYSIFKLGAIGADLGAVACFFEEPWSRPAAVLKEGDRAWLLNEAAFRLRALGRLEEALEPMRAGAEMAVKQEDWKNAAIYYSNLSELELGLGRVAAALADAGAAVEHADRSGDEFQRMGNRTTLADALHQHGEGEAALTCFQEAETLQAQRQPRYPLLYSLQGFRYCDLLLAGAERAAWKGVFTADSPVASEPWASQAQPNLRRCGEVAERAAQTLRESEEYPDTSLLTIALDHLTLSRCALYTALLRDGPSPDAMETAQSHTEHAVAGLRASGNQDDIPRGLLTRALVHHTSNNPTAARADLDEVQCIAERGGMRLHLADCHLTRARLFPDPPDQARAGLAEARRLIEACEYFRRLPELEDAEAALGRPGRHSMTESS